MKKSLSTSKTWDSELLFFSGADFFAHMRQGVRTAQKSVDLEFYIFEQGKVADALVEALIEAAERGVQVRLVVDGVGSPSFNQTYGRALGAKGISCLIYHNLLWSGQFMKTLRTEFKKPKGFVSFFKYLNRRSHRKFVVVDNNRGWIGSFNISDNHLQKPPIGELARPGWRDTGVCVEGRALSYLTEAFDDQFLKKRDYYKKKFKLWYKRRHFYLGLPIRLNNTHWQRKHFYRDLLARIRSAQQRVWITTAYFVPDTRLLKALEFAASKGVSVRILIPMKSDMPFMNWATRAYYEGLNRSGVEIFEYRPTMLHAKTIIIDNWCSVGTSNLNHRSLFHDLEVDAILTQATTRLELVGAFSRDLENSQKVSLRQIEQRSVSERALSAFVLFFRPIL